MSKIIYNGTTTEIVIGQIAVMSCRRKQLDTDVVIEFDAPGIIIYNDTETEVEAGKTATLQCAGKVMETDIIVAFPDFDGSAGIVSGTGQVTCKSLEITSLPNKTEFYVGDGPSYSGFEGKVTVFNGGSFTVNASEVRFTGLDTSTPSENRRVTVIYQGGVFTEYYIVVKERPHTESSIGTYHGLKIKTLPKTEYKVNDFPDVEGGVVVLQYTSGMTEEMEMTTSMLYGFDTSTPGSRAVSVKYAQDGYLGVATYIITVTE